MKLPCKELERVADSAEQRVNLDLNKLLSNIQANTGGYFSFQLLQVVLAILGVICMVFPGRCVDKS